MASKVACEVQSWNGNKADIARRNVKHVVQSQLVTSGHGNINRATANSRDKRTTKSCDVLRGNRTEGFEISASGGNMARGPAVKDKRKPRSKDHDKEKTSRQREDVHPN
jgi:hypothetical protein